MNLPLTMLVTALLLGSYAVMCIHSSGETLKVMKGVIEKCEFLGGGTSKSISHATIKTETGSYIISSVSECSPGAEVNIFINRGILYFNSIYAAENV
ncbi:MAG: hypothetical protein ACI89D_000274 [Bermanella sp.]